MALFNFGVDEWALFLFLFATLAIYTGAIGSYGEHVVTWAFGNVLEWPLANIAAPIFNSSFSFLTPFVLVAIFVLVINGFAKFVDPAVMGAVVFGVVVLSLGV